MRNGLTQDMPSDIRASDCNEGGQKQGGDTEMLDLGFTRHFHEHVSMYAPTHGRTKHKACCETSRRKGGERLRESYVHARIHRTYIRRWLSKKRRRTGLNKLPTTTTTTTTAITATNSNQQATGNEQQAINNKQHTTRNTQTRKQHTTTRTNQRTTHNK